MAGLGSAVARRARAPAERGCEGDHLLTMDVGMVVTKNGMWILADDATLRFPAGMSRQACTMVAE